MKVSQNKNLVNDVYCPTYWLNLCKSENTQFCPLSLDGYYHAVKCKDFSNGNCPYRKLVDESTYIVIINEQHKLFLSQEKLLSDRHVLYLRVPAQGLTLGEMEVWRSALVDTIIRCPRLSLVFASPIPYLIRELGRLFPASRVRLFHNDKREKKELPNGKIIMTVAQEGWQLV